MSSEEQIYFDIDFPFGVCILDEPRGEGYYNAAYMTLDCHSQAAQAAKIPGSGSYTDFDTFFDASLTGDDICVKFDDFMKHFVACVQENCEENISCETAVDALGLNVSKIGEVTESTGCFVSDPCGPLDDGIDVVLIGATAGAAVGALLLGTGLGCYFKKTKSSAAPFEYPGTATVDAPKV